MAKKTTEQFIEQAVKIHGDKYDYSEAVYDGAFVKVKIVCKQHGPFLMAPTKHLSGQKCIECSREEISRKKRSSSEDFIDGAMKVHGNKYDYSEVVYTGSDNKVRIICPEHGVWEQRPYSHLSGQGCKKCGEKRVGEKTKHTISKYIALAKIKHGDDYDYSLITQYTNQRTRVPLICRKCGRVFEIIAKNHLNGQGCRKCNTRPFFESITKSKEEALVGLLKVHGSKYSYDFSDYVNTRSKIKVNCKHHGEFLSTVKGMLRGRGCRKCGSDACSNKKIIGREVFIERATETHGEDYSYERVLYERAHIPVEIYCTKCGSFFYQTPTHHMAGAGCPCCAPYGFQTGDIGSLYLINCESSFGVFTGYGISNQPEQRLRQHTLSLSKSAFVITRQHVWNFQTGASALALENAVKKQFSQASTLGCSIAGFKRESTDAPFDQVKEFIENILQENPEWQLT